MLALVKANAEKAEEVGLTLEAGSTLEANKIYNNIITQRITPCYLLDVLLMAGADAKSFGIAMHRCTAMLQFYPSATGQSPPRPLQNQLIRSGTVHPKTVENIHFSQT